jgi:transposase
MRSHSDGDVETSSTAATLGSLARRSRELTAEAADHRAEPSWRWSGPGDPTCSPEPGSARSWPPPCCAPGPTLAAAAPMPPWPCWAAPIPASSGQTIRVRRNRSGDRQLNQALDSVVLTRLRTDPATRAYAQRRRAQGTTNREINRCLVR